MDYKESLKNLENLQKTVDKVMENTNKAFASLDPETYAKVKEYHIDANDCLKKFKNGDNAALDKLIEKYKKA
tara:strand:+ start:97 stop:312 length:216 start_codon:yes stop_codon:yes gene_type:complete